MLAMISPLRRSEASARAFIARSCARSWLSASSMAEAIAPSVRRRGASLRDVRAAAKNLQTAKARMPASIPTKAVSPSSR